MSSHLSPTRPKKRIAILDVLRGFALLGILMVNMQWMNAPVAVSFSSVLGLLSGYGAVLLI